MRNNRKWLQIIILSAALVVGGIVISGSIFGNDNSARVGDRAPDFSLYGLDGKVYKLSELKGKSVVINFWGTFCPPCVREMPALQAQYEKWKDKDVILLGINLNESRVAVQSFIERVDVTYPILMDDDTVRKKYKVISYPTTFYVNADGIIQDIMIGEMQENDILLRIGKLVEYKN